MASATGAFGAAAVLLLTAVQVAGPAAPASADVVPTMSVTIDGENTQTLTLCGLGASDSGINQWRLNVDGFRSAGGPFVVPTIERTGATFRECVSIGKSGSTTGLITVTVTFVGVGIDVGGSFSGYVRWAPGQPDDSLETGIA